MNGSCAGGTGAFIDQTAALLNVDTKELDTLASTAETIYPIASRCGVFSRTDIQNLVSRNVSKNDIAASVFNAVAIQVISSLSRSLRARRAHSSYMRSSCSCMVIKDTFFSKCKITKKKENLQVK